MATYVLLSSLTPEDTQTSTRTDRLAGSTLNTATS